MPEPKDETCPDCGRIKARNAAGMGMGYCPKWYAIRDADAELDCDRVRQMKDGLHCLWSRADEDSDCWETSCGNAFCINDGTPKENNFSFCAYCGKPLIEDSDLLPVDGE